MADKKFMVGERIVSSTELRFQATIMPNKQPSAKRITTATAPSTRDHPMSWAMTCPTGVGKYWMEFPRLPWRRLPRYLKYCSNKESCVFRPNSAERVCCIEGVTYPLVDILPTSAATGSPGARRGMKKSSVIATQTAQA